MLIKKLFISSNRETIVNLTDIKLPEKGLVGIKTQSFSKAKLFLYTLAGLTEYFPNLNFKIDIKGVPNEENIQLLVEYPETQISGLKDYVKTEIALPLEERCRDEIYIAQKIKKISRNMKIEEILQKKITHLSTGEIQKTILSSLLITEPKLLLMMYPFSGLDFKSKETLLTCLKQQEKTLSIFFDLEDITHQISDFILDLDENILLTVNKSKKHTQSQYPTIFSKREIEAYEEGKIIYIRFSKYEKEEPTIKINNLTFQFKNENKEIIKNLSLKIYSGDKVLVIGKNGSGKTTLAKIICGFIKVPKKTVIVKNRPFFIPSDPTNMFIYNSAIEEIKNASIGKEISDEEIKYLLNTLDLYHKKDTSPFKLEMEDKKILSLAIAIATEAEIIIMDEPTNFTSGKFRRKLLKIIDELLQNKTVIVISHDRQLIDELIENWKDSYGLYLSV